MNLYKSNTYLRNILHLSILLLVASIALFATLVLAEVLTPNDPKFDSDTWDEDNPEGRNWGQEFIKLPSAWFIETGNKDIKVAIVDDGFDINHKDLKENIDLNPVGLKRSHGTHVAGIIGAKGNNEKGIAGVMWDSGLYLYGAGVYGEEYLDRVLAATSMKHSILHGAKVVNFSAGNTYGTLEDARKANDFWKEFVLKWVEDNNKDVLFVVSAGTTKVDAKFTSPTSLTEEEKYKDIIISVTAMNKDGSLGTNFGKLVTVAAPGEETLSTVPLFSTEDWALCYEIIPRPPDGYGCMSGSSQAAPFVSGLAGLIWSKAEEIGITLTAKNVKDLIVNGAIKGGKYVSGPDGYPIFIINAYESLKLLAPPVGVVIPTADITIDGDITDWEDIPVVTTSPQAPPGTYPLGADVKSLRLAKKDNMLYYLFEVWDPSIDTTEEVGYRLWFDNDKNGRLDDPADRQVNSFCLDGDCQIWAQDMVDSNVIEVDGLAQSSDSFIEVSLRADLLGVWPSFRLESATHSETTLVTYDEFPPVEELIYQE